MGRLSGVGEPVTAAPHRVTSTWGGRWDGEASSLLRLLGTFEELQRARRHDGRDRVLVDQLRMGVAAEQHGEVVEPGDDALELHAVHQEDGDRHFVFADVVQKDVLDALGFLVGHYCLRPLFLGSPVLGPSNPSNRGQGLTAGKTSNIISDQCKLPGSDGGHAANAWQMRTIRPPRPTEARHPADQHGGEARVPIWGRRRPAASQKMRWPPPLSRRRPPIRAIRLYQETDRRPAALDAAVSLLALV